MGRDLFVGDILKAGELVLEGASGFTTPTSRGALFLTAGQSLDPGAYVLAIGEVKIPITLEAASRRNDGPQCYPFQMEGLIDC